MALIGAAAFGGLVLLSGLVLGDDAFAWQGGLGAVAALIAFGVVARGGASFARVLLAVACFAGMAYVAGVLYGARPLAALGAFAAAAALAGYAVIAGRTAPARVRWSLVAGAATLAVLSVGGVLLPDVGAGIPETDGRGHLRPEYVAAVERWLDRTHWRALGLSVVAGCVAVAMSALPVRRGPWAAVATVAGGLVLSALVLLPLSSWLWYEPAGPLVGAVWPVLLAAIVAIVAAAIGARRARVGWLAAGGGLLLAVPALMLVRDIVRTASVTWTPPGTGILISMVLVVPGVYVDGRGAAAAAALLAGCLLAAAGALANSGRPAGGSADGPPDGSGSAGA